jgi:hypothetical protein
MLLRAALLFGSFDGERRFPTCGRMAPDRFRRLHLQKVGQPWGLASAEYGTSSLGENQGFASPRTVHNMRTAGPSTTRSDSHPTRGEGFLLPIRTSPLCYAGHGLF